MESFRSEASEYTPLLDFNPESGEFKIEGVSRPEDVQEFYNPAVEWINDFVEKISEKSPDEIHLIFKLTYCNSSSFKFILLILEALMKVQDKGHHITVDWYYEESDEQMMEDGEDIEDATGLDFHFHPY
jgi:hypothetical protein